MIKHYEWRGGKENCPESSNYRLTPLGAWAKSRLAHAFFFFKQVQVFQYRLFLDLGSGDGGVVCMAGLFTRSVGIEGDPELVAIASRAARDLGLNEQARFICADFRTQRIQAADCLYIYPDKPLYALEDMLDDWRGTLLVYGPHFPPRKLPLERSLRCGRETLTVYSRM